MKSIKTLRFTKSVIAIALAASGFSTSGMAALNALGTPDDGHICRAGYTASFNGTSLKCSKTSKVVVKLICADAGFPNYVSRAVGSNGTNDGQDVCARNTVNITSTSNLDPKTSGLTKGQDFVSAKPNLAAITEKTIARDLEEGVAIGGSAGSVETISAEPVFARQSGGDITDSATVTLTHFSFPVPTAGIISGPVGTPASTFVPRPLQ
jgi:hypothetical protein